jgi:hypothetical protein
MDIEFWSKKLKGRDHLEDLHIDDRIISEWLLGKYSGKEWNGFIWFRMRTSGTFS